MPTDRDPRRARRYAQATVGLEALIDEATGFQAERPKDALAKRYRELGGRDEDYRAPDAPDMRGEGEDGR